MFAYPNSGIGLHNTRQITGRNVAETSQFGELMHRGLNVETWLKITSIPFTNPDGSTSKRTAPILNLFVNGRVDQNTIKDIINRHLGKCHTSPVYYQVSVREDEHLIRRYTSQTGRTEDLSIASAQNRDPGLVHVGASGNSLIRIYVGFHEERLERGIIDLLLAIATDVAIQVEKRPLNLLRS